MKTESIVIQDTWTENYGLTARMTVFNARSIPLIKYAYDYKDYTELSEKFHANEVYFAVAASYFQVDAMEQTVEVARENLENARAFHRLAVAGKKVGFATRIDVLRAESQLLDAENFLDNALESVEHAKTSLAVLMGTSTDYEIIPPGCIAPVSTDLETLMQTAMKQRRDFQAAKIRVQLADRLRQDVLAQWLPSFDLSYAWNWNSDSGFGSQNDSWHVQLNARWSILEGGAGKADLAQKKSNIQIAKNDLENLELKIRDEVEANLVEYRKRLRNVALAGHQIEVAAETHRLISRQYEVGLATSLDLLTAVNQLTKVQRNKVIENLGLSIAAMKLNKSVGEMIPPSR